MSVVLEMLQYPFMVRALVVGILISICASLLGTSLVLKRYSMIGDSLSHVGFAALAVSYAFYLDPLVVSIPVTMGAAFLLLELKESMRIKGDAATALLCSSALAVGVLAISLTRGMNTDVSNYMFGSILAMSSADVWLSLTAGSIIILLYILFYHPLFAVTFDESFASASGVRSHFYHLVLALMTAVTIVLGMRMMGALLISSLIVFPAITAMQICHRYLTTIEASTLVGLVCFLSGFVRLVQRRDRDSNPGYLAVQRFSRPPQSTTLPPLQDFFFQKYFLLKALQRYDFILNKQIVYQFFCYKIFKSYFCIRIINERNKS